MVTAARIQVGLLFCLCFEVIATLNLNRTHLFPAITLRSMCVDLCGEPTCFKSNDAVETMIIADLCLDSNDYSTNQRCIGSGFCGRPTKQMLKHFYWRHCGTYLKCFESHAAVVSEIIAILNVNRTHLFPAITRRSMCADLCGEPTKQIPESVNLTQSLPSPTCFKSYEVLVYEAMTNTNLCCTRCSVRNAAVSL